MFGTIILGSRELVVIPVCLQATVEMDKMFLVAIELRLRKLENHVCGSRVRELADTLAGLGQHAVTVTDGTVIREDIEPVLHFGAINDIHGVTSFQVHDLAI